MIVDIFKILLKILFAVFITAILYVGVIEMYLINTITAIELSHDEIIKVQLQELTYQNYSLYEKADYIYGNLQIHTLFSDANIIIFSIYIAMYIFFLLHTLTIFLSKYISMRYAKNIMYLTKNSLVSLGTTGTMISIAIAMKGRAEEVSNISQLIQGAFFDSIYTTIIGLNLYILALGLSVFDKRNTT